MTPLNPNRSYDSVAGDTFEEAPEGAETQGSVDAASVDAAEGADTHEHADDERSSSGTVRNISHDVRAAALQAHRLLRELARTQPYAVAGVAAGVGFLLGGGLRSRAVPLVLGAVARAAGVWLTNEILDRTPDEDGVP